jgi:type IV fimbrial biogenesis protein FimT
MRTHLGRKGFTLIEAMIGLAVGSILAAIGTPMIMAAIPRFQIQAEARQLVTNFKKAQLEAVKRNREVCIDFIGVGVNQPVVSYRVFVNMDRDTNNPHTFDASDILITIRRIRDDITNDRHSALPLQFSSTTFTNSQAGYNPMGLPTQLANQNVVLGLIDGTRSYTLSISQTGNVRLR